MISDLGIIVPAYRPDTERLATYVRALNEQLRPKTIRIELDTPSRSTLEELRDLPASINASTDRRGKGAAITAGFEALETDILAFADADGSTSVESFGDVIDRVKAGEAALSVGSRRHPNANVTLQQSKSREYLGHSFVWLAQRALPVWLTDYQCGAKAISAAAWHDVRPHLLEAGFAWDIELIGLTAALGNRVVEVPVEWTEQPGSTVDPTHDSIRMLRALSRTYHRAQRLRGNRLHRTLKSDPETPLIDRIQDGQPTPLNA